MTQVIEFIRTRNIELGELIRQLVYLLVGFNYVNWDDTQQMLVFAVVSGALALFMTKQNVPSNKVDAIVDKGIERAAKVERSKSDGDE